MFECPNLLMANNQELVKKVKEFLDQHNPPHPIRYLRALVSSPRLSDHFVRGLDPSGLVLVADSFLSEHTMIGDHAQKTYGVSLETWTRMKDELDLVENFHFRDQTVSRIQVWPFNPALLELEAMKIAVALSFTDLEMIYESRVYGAVDDLLSEYKIDAFPGM
ncbi:hypothetical protein [Pseudomonas sp. NBRC 111139]|uniref:hypothetical protein n=1 Tax=Pseudomonas sp. NBRC 111139 TaxID=1661054 RepID=UPI0008637B02|nr:hypothetical protein [Pseudomonas sp. NBRC 111139]